MEGHGVRRCIFYVASPIWKTGLECHGNLNIPSEYLIPETAKLNNKTNIESPRDPRILGVNWYFSRRM